MGAVSEFGGHVGGYLLSMLAFGVCGLFAIACLLAIPQIVGMLVVGNVAWEPVERFVFYTHCVPDGEQDTLVCSSPRVKFLFLAVHAVCSLLLALGLWAMGYAGVGKTLAVYWGVVLVGLAMTGVVFAMPFVCGNYLVARLPAIIGEFFHYEWCSGDGIKYWRSCMMPFHLLQVPAFHLVAALAVAAIRVTVRTPVL